MLGQLGVGCGPHRALCRAVIFPAGAGIPAGPEGVGGAEGSGAGSRGHLGNSTGPTLPSRVQGLSPAPHWELVSENACDRTCARVGARMCLRHSVPVPQH